MDSEMRRQLDALMDGYALYRGSASHPSDRQKLRNFFIRWYERGVALTVADWEHYLKHERKWTPETVCEVIELPEDVASVARHFRR